MNLIGMLRLLRIKEQKELHIDFPHLIVIHHTVWNVPSIFCKIISSFHYTLKSNLIKYLESFQIHGTMMRLE